MSPSTGGEGRVELNTNSVQRCAALDPNHNGSALRPSMKFRIPPSRCGYCAEATSAWKTATPVNVANGAGLLKWPARSHATRMKSVMIWVDASPSAWVMMPAIWTSVATRPMSADGIPHVCPIALAMMPAVGVYRQDLAMRRHRGCHLP